MTFRTTLLCCLTILWSVSSALAEAPGPITFQQDAGRIEVRIGEGTFVSYVFDDETITRPYFCSVHTLSGVQVTRNHPPAPDDLPDHATFHPGIWLAFGDLSGHDSWRLKAPVRHVEFVEQPAVSEGIGSFTVRNRYLSADGASTICEEVCRYEFRLVDDGCLLTWDSRFRADGEFTFGDQEEMGLGVRLATSIAENQDTGGLLTDSENRTSAADVWGRQADWCDYSGVVDGSPVGVTIMPHPENFRASWWHARNYGFFAANPFGRNAFTKQAKSRVVVRGSEEFRLRYGIVIHDGRPGEGYDPAEAYADYVGE